ncbi:MAG: glycosyltransferase [Flavobacteriales bacterium]|nr:glycosyltransferase [Flavobacteriales bacterium]
MYRYYWSMIAHYHNYFIHEDDSVLEIGCGTGDTLSILKGINKTGIDFSENMIDVAKELHPDIEFHVMDAENIQLDNKYDVIVLSNVVSIFDNVIDVLNSVKRVCHPRTKIFITSPNYFWYPIVRLGELLRLKKKAPESSWLTPNDIRNMLHLTGFESYRSAKGVLIPINIPVISWFANKFFARLPLLNNLCLNNYIISRPIIDDADFENRYSSTIVIPARNESGNIEDAILRMPQFGKHIEIIFVEGNSTDDTWEKIKEIQSKYADTHDIKIMQQEGKGKGDAVRKGYRAATGDILMILDADLTMPPEELPKFYDALAFGKGEFINGCRLVYPMEKDAMRFLNILGNKFFSMAFSWLLESSIKDTLCGTKVMFRTDYEKLIKNKKFFGDFDPFGDFDLIFGAYKLNLKLIDLPIRYQERIYGDTNISRFKHGFILLRMCMYATTKIKFW